MVGLAWQKAAARDPVQPPQRIPATSVDLAFHSLRAADEPVIALECAFDGHLDERLLVRAGELLPEVEPMVGYRLVADSPAPHWQRIPASERGIVTVARSHAEYEAIRRAGLDAGRGPQVAVCLWPCEAGDRLIVKTTHELGDGVALQLVVGRLGSLYTALTLDPDHRPAAGVIPTRDPAQILGLIPKLARVRAVLGLGCFIAPRLLPRTRYHPRFPDESTGSWAPVVRRLPAPSLASLHRYARQRGATVNDLFLAAGYRALACSGWDEKSALRITITVDLRRWCLPPEHGSTVANLSSWEFPFLMRDLGRRFDDTLARVSALTRRRKRSRPGLAYALIALFMVRNLARDWTSPAGGVRSGPCASAKSRSFMTLSNEGPLENWKLGFAGLTPVTAHVLPPFAGLPRLHVCVSSYADTLTLASGTAENGVASVERFLDALIRELPGDAADARAETSVRAAADALV